MVPSAYFRKEGQSNYTLKASSGWNETTHFGIVFTFHYVFLRHGKVHSISKVPGSIKQMVHKKCIYDTPKMGS